MAGKRINELLGISWENFDTAIKRAITFCETTGIKASDHFREVTKMAELDSGAMRNVDYSEEIIRQVSERMSERMSARKIHLLKAHRT